MATQSTTAEILFAAISRDELPTDSQTLEDFGFTRCRSLIALVLFFEAYSALAKTCGVTHEILDQWRAGGTIKLVNEVRRTLKANEHRIDSSVYNWYYVNSNTVVTVSNVTGKVVNVRLRPSLSMRELKEEMKRRMPERETYVEWQKKTLMAYPTIRKKIEAGVEDLSALANQAADRIYGKEGLVISSTQANNKISITGTTTEILLAHIASREDSLELQNMDDYAMSRCHFAPEMKLLLKVYIRLLSTCGIKPATLHTWNAEGLKSLGQKIKTEFIKKQDSLPAGLVDFVMENQWIWDADDVDGEVAALWRTPDLNIRFRDKLSEIRAIKNVRAMNRS